MGRIEKAPKPKAALVPNSDRQRLAIHIGHQLWKLRQRDFETMREVAEACQLSNAFICQIENGQSIPTADTLWRIANHFQVSMDYFFEGYKT